MEFTDDLKKTTDSILTAIERAAAKSQVNKVQELSRLLSDAQFITHNFGEMEKRLRKLKEELETLQRPAIEPNADVTFGNLTSQATVQISAKANAKNVRQNFIKMLNEKGIVLNPYKGVTFMNPKNNGLVGIAYSCDNGNNWFLGLPDKKYTTIVLLCDSNKSGLRPIILPGVFYEKHSPNMSRSGGQVKFNVRTVNDKLNLYTRAGNVLVDNYIFNYDSFA